MIVTALVEPEALATAHFDNHPSYRQGAQLFFRGIMSNGLLMVDGAGTLEERLKTVVRALPTQHGQQLQILLADLLKNKRRRIVRLDTISVRGTASIEAEDMERLVSTGLPDGVVVPPGGAAAFARLETAAEALVLDDYGDSEFEQKRRWMFEDVPPIDQLPPGDVDRLLIRTIRFAEWLRFYDKQIGSGRNLSNFRRGLEHILVLWSKHGYFASRGRGTVEIVTVESEPVRDDESERIQEKARKLNEDTVRSLESKLAEPLRKRFPWDIRLRVKKDADGIFHARHIQAQCAVLLVERGFDFLASEGHFRRVIVKIDNGSYEHLRECRALPQSEASSAGKLGIS